MSPTAIELSNENSFKAGTEPKFIEGNVLDLPFEENQFDLVVDDHCFHCIIGDDRSQFLQEAHRVLKMSGILLVRSMCGLREASNEIMAQFDAESRCLITDGFATRYIGDSDSIIAEVKQAGFIIQNSQVLVSEPGGSDMVAIEAQRA